MQWFIHSEDGADYRVGAYLCGEWVPGSQQDAERECLLLEEPEAYIWAKPRRVVVAPSSL